MQTNKMTYVHCAVVFVLAFFFRFLPPIELPVIYEIDDSELKAYGNKLQKGVYSQVGKLKFSILTSRCSHLNRPLNYLLTFMETLDS